MTSSGKSYTVTQKGQIDKQHTMIHDLFEKKEKKVEYIELIYDLIFVYVIGRNNALLHIIRDGFVDRTAFLAYIACTVAVIQIWTFSAYYINVFGRKGVQEYVFLCINMFLLYFIAEGTRAGWERFQTQYHVAWALILVNIGVQYLIELIRHKEKDALRKRIIRLMCIIFAEAAIVAAGCFPLPTMVKSYLAYAAILFGIVAILISGKHHESEFVDFPHLSERAMLYVVFTFGEMIIAIATYFDGENTLRNLYFALMAFLIVVGLFLSYGVLYDHIVDREKKTNGVAYMVMHIFIIFALNNITAALEFMREEEVDLLPKMLFLTISFVLYFFFLFAISIYAKPCCRARRNMYLPGIAIGIAFAVCMLLLRTQMMLNIAITVLFVFGLFLVIYRYGKKVDAYEKEIQS